MNCPAPLDVLEYCINKWIKQIKPDIDTAPCLFDNTFFNGKNLRKRYRNSSDRCLKLGSLYFYFL